MKFKLYIFSFIILLPLFISSCSEECTPAITQLDNVEIETYKDDVINFLNLKLSPSSFIIYKNTLVCAGLNDDDMAVVYRTDFKGNLIWKKVLPTENRKRSPKISKFGENQLFISSFTRDFGSSNSDLIYFVLNDDGSIDFSQNVTKTPNEEDVWGDIIPVPNGDVIFVSSIPVPNYGPLSNTLKMGRINKSGNVIWTKEIDKQEHQHLYKQLLNVNDGISFLSLSSFFQDYVNIYSFDYNGNLKFKSKIESQAEYKILLNSNFFIQTEDKGFLVAFSDDNLDCNSSDLRLHKLDKNGQIEWSHRYGDLGTDDAEGLLETKDKSYIALSRKVGSFMIIKIDRSGKVIWGKEYGNSAFYSSSGIIEKDNGNFIIVAATNHNTGGKFLFDTSILEIDSNGKPVK